MNPPSLWITINPCDPHNPIAQIFAGKQINMAHFFTTVRPNKENHAQNIADDPFAASHFFHFMIRTILQTLFGVVITKFQVKVDIGVLGKVAAYFGTVEFQGWRSLHLHLLVWLRNVPTSDKMQELLKTEEFDLKVIEYIRANLCAYLPGLDSAQAVKSIPNEAEIAYSYLPHPDSANYEDDVKKFELWVARAKQVHTCEFCCCLFWNMKGQLQCKCMTPLKYLEVDMVTKSGHWAPKRLYEFMNGWIPALTINV
jgi:hypothetical protein